uniref:DNA replication complex GINS protein PSF2 n=1 Tax=Zooxanthella nutricula TaxID=1333877 RepID=A0A7S2Q981_9DINO
MSFCTEAAARVNTKDTSTLLGDDKFMALELEVDIIPRFSSDSDIECIKGRFGPFRAHSAAKVPLWAALEMDRLQICSIEVPHWLHEEELKIMKDDEKHKDNADRFTPVPEHYIETAFALLTQSKAFNGDAAETRRTIYLMRELIECRRNKIIKGLMSFDSQTSCLDVTNMSAAERTCFRTRSVHSLDTFMELMKCQRVTEKDEEEGEEDAIDLAAQEDSSSLL